MQVSSLQTDQSTPKIFMPKHSSFVQESPALLQLYSIAVLTYRAQQQEGRHGHAAAPEPRRHSPNFMAPGAAEGTSQQPPGWAHGPQQHTGISDDKNQSFN